MEKDTIKRTIIKTVFFKFLTTTGTMLITGMSAGNAIGLHIILTSIYLVYERVWNKIKWGKKNEVPAVVEDSFTEDALTPIYSFDDHKVNLNF